MGICTLCSLHAQNNLVLVFFPPYHTFINNNKSTIGMYFEEAIDIKIMTKRATSFHDKSGTYDSAASQQTPTSYSKSKPYNRPSLPQEGLLSN